MEGIDYFNAKMSKFVSVTLHFLSNLILIVEPKYKKILYESV